MIAAGVFSALITPFTQHQDFNPELDLPLLDPLIEEQLSAGIAGFVVCSSTGEAATLNPEERLLATKHVVDLVAKRVPVVVGTGALSTKESIEFTRAARQLGAEAALVLPPPVTRISQESLYQHVKHIADDGGLPLIVSSETQTGGADFTVQTLGRVASIPQVIAFEESSGTAERLMTVLETVENRLAILCGRDTFAFEVLAAGGAGMISSSANIIPQSIVQMFTLSTTGKFHQALSLQLKILPFIRLLSEEPLAATIKASLRLLRRLPNDAVRLPLVPVQEEYLAQLVQAIEAQGLLKT